MLVMIFSLIFCVFAQEISWGVHREHLKDGLELYVHTISGTGMVSVMFRYQLKEGPQDGMAHFAEHWMFSYQTEGLYYDQVLEDMGGKSQGSTDLSSMKIVAHIPIERWNDLMVLEKERRENLCDFMDEQTMETQRMVVLQEYQQGIRSADRRNAQELRSSVFGLRGAGDSVIGTNKAISSWNIDMICSYMKEELFHSQMDIIVVGDISKEEAREGIYELFSSHQIQKDNEVKKDKIEVKQHRKGDSGNTTYALWPIPPQNHTDTQALTLWMRLLTHERFGSLQKRGIRASGWIEYGVEGGYVLLRMEGKTAKQREELLRNALYGVGGWLTMWRYTRQISAYEHRRAVHSWNTQEGRAVWIEHCIRTEMLDSCFEPVSVPSYSDLINVRKRWMSWEHISWQHVVSP